MTIKTFTQLIQVLQSMSENLPTFAADLGTTAADQTFLERSLANALYVENYAEMMDVNKKAYFAIKQRFYNGEKGEIADGPPTDAYSPPFPLNGDTHGELMKLIGRVEDANKYSHDIGVALGIAGDSPEPPNLGEAKPSLDAFPAQSGFGYSVVVGNRSGIDMWELEVQVVGASSWTSVGRFDGKAQNITYSGATGPTQIRLRVRLWKGGQSIGLYSDEVVITVNP